MLAIISLELREKSGFLQRLGSHSGFNLCLDYSLRIRLFRLEIFYKKGITNKALRRRVHRALTRLSKTGVNRLVLPKDFEFTQIVLDMGFRIVDPKQLYRRILPQIVLHCAGILNVDLSKTAAVIHGGHDQTNTLYIACELGKSIRYLSVSCSNPEMICDKLANTLGISGMTGDIPSALYETRIDIFLNPTENNTILTIDGYSLSAPDIDFSLPERYENKIPQDCIASFLEAMSENGVIFPKEIFVKEVLLRKTVA